MEKTLSNEITPEILLCLKTHISEIFSSLYYVNSKKAISHLLRYIYRLYPEMVLQSVDVLNYASAIPNIN